MLCIPAHPPMTLAATIVRTATPSNSHNTNSDKSQATATDSRLTRRPDEPWRDVPEGLPDFVGVPGVTERRISPDVQFTAAAAAALCRCGVGFVVSEE